MVVASAVERAGSRPAARDRSRQELDAGIDLTRLNIGRFGRRILTTPAAGSDEAMERDLLVQEVVLVRQPLFGWRGLAFRSRENMLADMFWDMYSRQVLGVPSLLQEKTLTVFDPLPIWLDKVFQAANDEDWLQVASRESRP